MHEHSFIQAIIGNIGNKDNVSKIEVEVGELAGIEADHLKEHLEKETSWEVTTSTRPAIISCKCSYKGSPKILQRLHDMVIFECPKCHAIPKVKEGKDIKILKVTYS
jgi:Zn finger protein HypA/HybF involved in hydrogenase expression